MSNETECFESEFDLVIKQKQCQCAKVNQTNTETLVLIQLESVKQDLEMDWLWGGCDITRKAALAKVNKAIELIKSAWVAL